MITYHRWWVMRIMLIGLKTEKDGKWRNSYLVLDLLAKIKWIKDAQIRKRDLNIAI